MKRMTFAAGSTAAIAVAHYIDAYETENGEK